jgi:hypothetical protein
MLGSAGALPHRGHASVCNAHTERYIENVVLRERGASSQKE